MSCSPGGVRANPAGSSFSGIARTFQTVLERSRTFPLFCLTVPKIIPIVGAPIEKHVLPEVMVPNRQGDFFDHNSLAKHFQRDRGSSGNIPAADMIAKIDTLLES